jgi:hypothetical protein
MICPQKPALKLPQGVRSCELLDTNCLQRLLPADLISACTFDRGPLCRFLDCQDLT